MKYTGCSKGSKLPKYFFKIETKMKKKIESWKGNWKLKRKLKVEKKIENNLVNCTGCPESSEAPEYYFYILIKISKMCFLQYQCTKYLLTKIIKFRRSEAFLDTLHNCFFYAAFEC